MAAPFQNYSDGTFLSDLVVRPEFLAYVQEETYNRCQWIQSGVVTRDSALDCRAGGTRVRKGGGVRGTLAIGRRFVRTIQDIRGAHDTHTQQKSAPRRIAAHTFGASMRGPSCRCLD